MTTCATHDVVSLAILAICWTCAAQDFRGVEIDAARAKIEQMRREGKPIPPAPRLPDGHPDLGNAAGSWFGPTLGDMSGHGQGTSSLVPGLPPGEAMPEGVADVEKLNLWRIVWMDGRKHTPADKLNLSSFGESIGRWDGDTLVIDVIGQSDQSWIDSAGHPKTEKIHVVERWRRPNPQILHYEATIDDPGAYSGPWSTSWNMLFKPGAELLDYSCVNNPDPKHMVGK